MSMDRGSLNENADPHQRGSKPSSKIQINEDLRKFHYVAVCAPQNSKYIVQVHLCTSNEWGIVHNDTDDLN